MTIKKTTRICIGIVILILGIVTGFVLSSFRSSLRKNEQALTENILGQQEEIFEGTILKIAVNSGLIQIDDGFSIRSSGDQAWIYLNDEVKQEAAVGKRVKVRYDGMVQESYPLQIPGLLAVELLEEED